MSRGFAQGLRLILSALLMVPGLVAMVLTVVASLVLTISWVLVTLLLWGTSKCFHMQDMSLAAAADVTHYLFTGMARRVGIAQIMDFFNWGPW